MKDQAQPIEDSTIGSFEYENHLPDQSEQDALKYLEVRRKQMDTDYRKKVISTAVWSRDEYDAIPDKRINNLDMFKTGLSRAVVDHNLVMLYDNPSKAIYRSVEESDKYRLTILEAVDKYDKDVSKYASIYQQLERTARIEGVSIAWTTWHEEENEKGEVIGVISTLTDTVDIDRFYWDEAGTFLNGNGAQICNDAAASEIMSMSRFRARFSDEKYKNIEAVLPTIEFPVEELWSADWVDSNGWTNFSPWASDGDYVHVYTYKCKKFWDKEGRKFVDREFIIANGQIIYDDKMDEPEILGEKMLPWTAIVGIPTGNFAGLGIPALIRHPQEALDRMLTMTEAQAELAVNPVLFYQTAGDLLPDTIDYHAGAAYPYKGTGNGITNDLQFFQQPDITQGATYTIDKMISIITIITGVDIQALLDTTDEKAIQTQNKREIQEKILKMSVLWNETHGWADMAKIRLAYIQEYYPVSRTMRIIGENGYETVTGYPKIKIKDFSVKQGLVKGKQVDQLIEKSGAYSSLSISPEYVRFGVDVYIESSTIASGVDTVKQNKWIKTLDDLARIPNSGQITDPVKLVKGTIKYSGFKQTEIMADSLADIADDQHPARKEFKAILISEDIPFEPIPPKNYNPEAYLYIFGEMMKLPEYKQSSPPVKKLMQERMAYHATNFADPYFKERQLKGQEQEQKQAAEADRESNNTLKPIGGNTEAPTSLSSKVKSEAAKIGKKTEAAKK